MRRSALVLVLLCLVCTASGMIATLRTDELVRKAQIICIAKVLKISEIAVDSEQIATVKNVLQPQKILKGDWNLIEPLVIMTYSGGKAGFPGWIEDQVEFPPKGRHVVLFLEKGDDGTLRTVNTVQGMWPLKDDLITPLGMGQETSLDQIRKIIQDQK